MALPIARHWRAIKGNKIDLAFESRAEPAIRRARSPLYS
jgi:3D (Asp-Asp-Asp) domain-containing protein